MVLPADDAQTKHAPPRRPPGGLIAIAREEAWTSLTDEVRRVACCVNTDPEQAAAMREDEIKAIAARHGLTAHDGAEHPGLQWEPERQIVIERDRGRNTHLKAAAGFSVSVAPGGCGGGRRLAQLERLGEF